MTGSERGQATTEWVALVLVATLALAALAGVATRVDGRSLGATLARSLACAARGGCAAERDALVAAYGERDAALVRRYAPGLVYEPGTGDVPVDWRRCRSRACSLAPDERGLDTTRSLAGERATAFTHVVRRGRFTYLQYWLYYPDSNTTWAGSDKAWATATAPAALAHRVWPSLPAPPAYPGYHPDDWEGVEIRVGPDGAAAVRATSHGHWQWCKQRRCRNVFGAFTGWSRVSRGSHAGHIPLASKRHGLRVDGVFPFAHGRSYSYEPLYPGAGLDERTTAAPGLRLVPLETVRGRRDVFPAIDPPWEKRAWSDPEWGGS
ncbi:MAG: hypothetical protein IRZ21_11325 [Thermoleophilaceae bacterium]|nr:hypothetical protein [Thermoleophilaceae bacterium]